MLSVCDLKVIIRYLLQRTLRNYVCMTRQKKDWLICNVDAVDKVNYELLGSNINCNN